MRTLALICASALAMQAIAGGVVDIHSHLVTPEYLAHLERHRALLDEGFPIPKWNAESDLRPCKDMILKDNALALFGITPAKEKETSNMDNLLVRMAEIEVHPEWLERYLAAARTVGAESVAKEPGVICIFPMQQKENPCVIRIVEIYRDEAAYKAHLQTPHFRAYKEGTPHMIKSLNLVPMSPLDPDGMKLIFRTREGPP